MNYLHTKWIIYTHTHPIFTHIANSLHPPPHTPTCILRQTRSLSRENEDTILFCENYPNADCTQKFSKVQQRHQKLKIKPTNCEFKQRRAAVSYVTVCGLNTHPHTPTPHTLPTNTHKQTNKNEIKKNQKYFEGFQFYNFNNVWRVLQFEPFLLL